MHPAPDEILKLEPTPDAKILAKFLERMIRDRK
jgi:hypothetical protein